jgi:amino acid transporter
MSVPKQRVSVPEQRAPGSQLHRILKTRDVLTLAFGAIIGWSWVLMTGHWIVAGGSLGTLLAFAAGGVAIILIGLTYAELAAALPFVGGEHVYTRRALGEGASFVCSWALVMAYVTICVFESVALPTALVYLFPEIRLTILWTVAGAPVDLGFVLVGIAGAAIMTAINLVGIRTAAIVQTAITFTILVSGAVLIVGAARFGDATHLEPLLPNGLAGAMGVLIMVPAMLVGFDVIPQSAEEIDLPPRRIGQLLVASVCVAVVFYALVTLAVAVSAPAATWPNATLATADAASALWGGSWAGTLLVIGGIGGILTSWNAFIIGASRVLLSMSESGQLPAAFARVHPRFRTPWIGVLAIGVASMAAPLFGRTILVWLIDAGSFAVMVAYVCVAAAFLALRRNEPHLIRPFRVPAGRTVGVLAMVLGVALILIYFPGSPSALRWPEEWAIVLAWAGVGVLVYLTRTRPTGAPSGHRGSAARTDPF